MTATTRPAPPRGFMCIDPEMFDHIVPAGCPIELPPPTGGYATAVTPEGRRYCRWVEGDVELDALSEVPC